MYNHELWTKVFLDIVTDCEISPLFTYRGQQEKGEKGAHRTWIRGGKKGLTVKHTIQLTFTAWSVSNLGCTFNPPLMFLF